MKIMLFWGDLTDNSAKKEAVQGTYDPSFRSGIGYRMAALHGSEYFKAFECLEVIRSASFIAEISVS